MLILLRCGCLVAVIVRAHHRLSEVELVAVRLTSCEIGYIVILPLLGLAPVLASGKTFCDACIWQG